MKAFSLEILAQTASFRNPEFQNFHKTLELPPPTTVIGFAGAALGLSPKMAQDFFDTGNFQIGIAGYSDGRMRDTWKYNKRTSSMHVYDPLLDGSVIQKEYLVHNQFFLVFCNEDETRLERLRTAFQFPKFALTMGNSDALAKIKLISKSLDITESSTLKNCLVQGDVVGETMRRSMDSFEFSLYQTSEPISFDLPVRFSYKSDYGKRSVSKNDTFSFIGQEMQLNFKVKGVKIDDLFIPIFPL
ncbi:MAG: CRISPR-associated protein Cas5 [Bacteroidota bacterium]